MYAVSDVWRPVIAESDFPEDGKYAAKIGEWSVFIARTDDGLFAINDCCSHQASHLSAGKVRRGAIMCPLHGARFELANGKCVGGAYPNIRSFPLRIENGQIEVALPSTPPTVTEVPVPDPSAI